MNYYDPNVIAALQRAHLKFFLMKTFELLHPGAPPLHLAWYLEALCNLLEQTQPGARRRDAIAMPPRHLKSITTSVAFVAWMLGHYPHLKIMVATYSHDLARQHAENCRTVMESDWYRRLFPGTRIADRGNRALEIITTAGGGRKAISVGGSTTGFGADIIIVDDSMKADDARSQAARDEVRGWFYNTLMTRLNDQRTGSVISIQQRLHEDDLPASLLEKGFTLLKLPAIAEKEEVIELDGGRTHFRAVGSLLDPSRQDQSTLDAIRRELGPVVFNCQYQQDPVVPEGNLLRWEWFSTYDESEDRAWYHKVVQSWDTGMSSDPSSDYSVCTTWGFRAPDWYLLHVYRERLDYPDLKRAVIRHWRAWEADKVVIEDAGSGKSLWQEFRTQGPFKPLMWRPEGDKEGRLIGCLGEIEAGRIYLPAEAPWLDAFRSEVKAFPNGRHDDQVDSMTQFIEFALQNWKWSLTQYDRRTGRAINIVRYNRRPY